MRKVKRNCRSSMASGTLVAIGAQGFLHPFFREIHADALANVIGLASGLETETAQNIAENVPREIDQGNYHIGRRAA